MMFDDNDKFLFLPFITWASRDNLIAGKLNDESVHSKKKSSLFLLVIYVNVVFVSLYYFKVFVSFARYFTIDEFKPKYEAIQ